MGLFDGEVSVLFFHHPGFLFYQLHLFYHVEVEFILEGFLVVDDELVCEGIHQ